MDPKLVSLLIGRFFDTNDNVERDLIDGLLKHVEAMPARGHLVSFGEPVDLLREIGR